MNKKLIIPIAIVAVLAVVIMLNTCGGRSHKIHLTTSEASASPRPEAPDSVALHVYVENSGSMDGYMIPGSRLKDAVYDYVSDLKRKTESVSLNYINSQVIPFSGSLEGYIRNLTPDSFRKAGGDRSNTDLRQILREILRRTGKNDLSVFVSDCILDISKASARDYFGNTQVSVKNSFRDALRSNPNLGVEILKLRSNFEGWWYSGSNKEHLSDVERPYYIWVIGDRSLLAELGRTVPAEEILGGIAGYAAFAPSEDFAYVATQTDFVTNSSGEITVDFLADLSGSLQEEAVLCSTDSYTAEDAGQVVLERIQRVKKEGSPYSHVLRTRLLRPETLRGGRITISYPALPAWVSSSNDDTGENVSRNLDKTTGILYLITGVSEAYEGHSDFGSIDFSLTNR